jgi:GNAT superfamily N-acetyltransferase
MSSFTIRPIIKSDHERIIRKIIDAWGAEVVAVHGTLYYPADLPGFGAFSDENMPGLITYHIGENSIEVVTLNSWQEGLGIGSALIKEVVQFAVLGGYKRLWLITTNDNTYALRFYQKHGFTISAIYPNAISVSRKLKPEIPMTGLDGIPIRDEIEMEMTL